MPPRICKNLSCPRDGKPFIAERTSARYCSGACRAAASRQRNAPPPRTFWLGDRSEFSERPSTTFNSDGTTALSRSALAEQLLKIAERDDDGEPKTGRRYWYLALSLGHVRPSMEAGDAAATERRKAQKRITDILGILRKQGRLSWDMVLDLTRELERMAVVRIGARRTRLPAQHLPGRPLVGAAALSDPDRREGHYGAGVQADGSDLADTVRFIARIRLAQITTRRGGDDPQAFRPHRAASIVFFISDLDPSGIDLQRSWEQALRGFMAPVSFVRLGLTMEQVQDATLNLDHLAVGVKPSDSRSKRFIELYGNRCWETDVLPASVIRSTLDTAIHALLDRRAWQRRQREIEAARDLL